MSCVSARIPGNDVDSLPWPRCRHGSGRGQEAEGAAMSLNAWEQQALDSIKSGLAGSDPGTGGAARGSQPAGIGRGDARTGKRSPSTLARGLSGVPSTAGGGSGVRSRWPASGFPAGRAAAVVGADNGRAHSGRGDPQYRRRSRYMHGDGGDGEVPHRSRTGDPIGFSWKGTGSSAGKSETYTPEFKEQAAKKVVDNSLPIAQVARELGVNDTTLGFWVKAYRKKIAGAAASGRNAGPGADAGARAPEPRAGDGGRLSLEKPRRTSRRSIGEREIRVHRCGVRHPGRG